MKIDENLIEAYINQYAPDCNPQTKSNLKNLLERARREHLRLLQITLSVSHDCPHCNHLRLQIDDILTYGEISSHNLIAYPLPDSSNRF